MSEESERITNGKSDDSTLTEINAAKGLTDSVGYITKHIRGVVMARVQEDMIDPFQLLVTQQISKIEDDVRQIGEKFQANVIEAVKSSRREIVEDRIKQFGIDDLIQKLTTAPELIASAQMESQQKSRVAADAKVNYESELININTSAAGQGMIGENSADRDAIIQLIEDRIKNEHAFGSKVNITYQSTGRSKAVLECRELSIETGRTLYKTWQVADRSREDTRIELEKLNNQFSALRSVSSLIVSVVG